MTDEERQRFARRLRERDAEIARLRSLADDMIAQKLIDNVKSVEKCERLRAALQPFAKIHAAPGGDLNKAVQVARAALEPKPWKPSIPSPPPKQEVEHLAEQCSILLRENEHLRAALRKIADGYYTMRDEALTDGQPIMIWQAVASAALEQKP